jgi:hypothetical protein
VKRRICQVGAALSVVPLAFGVTATAVAANHATTLTKVACRTSLSIAVPANANTVDNSATQAREFGTATCGKFLGQGVQADRFVADQNSGVTTVKYTLYFATGTVHGTYALTAQNDSLNFFANSYIGTLTVKGGTGAYKGMTGTGTMTCDSPDGIHTACVEHLKLK